VDSGTRAGEPAPVSFQTLRLSLDGALARLELARPEAAHAIDLQMARELMAAALELDGDARVRAVLLASSGRMFCAGGDLAYFRSTGDGLPAALREITAVLHSAVSLLAALRVPVVAAVNGAVAGAGIGLVCAADLVVCAASARFTLAYTRVGLTPDASSTWWLPRLLGARRAAELMLTNRTLSAAEALDWGLVNEVVPDAQLAERAHALARSLADGPTQAFAASKQLLRASAQADLEAQLEQESRAISDAARSADAREGMAAFFDKRPPKFQGR
jgi:2-(1,2-epoxy-1,2-dihydrophenyl)acetyl-CoA isomerase